MTTTILVVSDEVDEGLTPARLRAIAPDVMVSCGDLDFDHLEFLVDVCNVPLLYVPGNHDPGLRGWAVLDPARPSWVSSASADPPGPPGGTNIDGRFANVAGMTFAGLGGSHRYRPGPNQYTQRQMTRRALRLEARTRLARQSVDVLVAHSPVSGINDDPDDPAHTGFEGFRGLIRRLRPRLFLHGHVHPFGRAIPDVPLGETLVINAVPFRAIELDHRSRSTA